MEKKTNEYMEIDLITVFKALWKRIWAILLVMVFCGVAAFFYTSYVATPLYQADILMYVNNSTISVGSTNVSISPSEITAAESLVDTYLVILNSRSSMDEINKDAGTNYSYDQLSKMITSEAVNSTEIFRVIVTDKDPQEAQTIANSITKVLPTRISNVVDGSSVRIIDTAIVPSERSFPSVSKYTSIAMIIGFVISCVVIVLREMTDQVIHTENYLTQTYNDIPVLATIPDLLSSKSASGYSYNYK